MKYPQLVSTRAVNAISDWLVTRLEQLGVDPPLIYSRLLLSLLHTPLQINALDLAEISDDKIQQTFGNSWGGRKGNIRRFSSSDTETVKRLTAIKSLAEAVASDQQLAHIECLVDELCEKLREIERQITIEDHQYIHIEHSNESMKKSSSPEDPTKRYYRAFPALSKDWNTEHIVRMKPKCSSWPSSSSSGSNSYYQNNINNNNNNNNNSNNNNSKLVAKFNTGSGAGVAEFGGGGGGIGCGGGTTAGVKRKQKRRRNQAMSKGKSTGGYGGNSFNASNTVSGGGGGNITHRKPSGGISSSVWDTDFEGTWEMGPDLIREFVMTQNNRNRSISESDAMALSNFQAIVKQRGEGAVISSNNDNENDVSMHIQNMLHVVSNTKENFRHSFCPVAAVRVADPVLEHHSDTSALMICNTLIRDEGYATPDTLTHYDDVDNKRRLYEREVSNESINTLQNEEAIKLARYEAKFDRNIEALWDDTNAAPLVENNNRTFAGSPPPSFMQPSGNVDSFWFNYYKHRYNNESNECQSLFTGNPTINDNKQSLADGPPETSVSLTMKPDLFNMNKSSATILAKMLQYSQSVQGQQNIESSGVGNQSIWSESVPTEDDVSFYSHALSSWNLNGPASMSAVENVVQTSQMDLVNNIGGPQSLDSCMNNNNKLFSTAAAEATATDYTMANISKWSDCTFETPFIPTTSNISSVPAQQSTAFSTTTNQQATASITGSNIQQPIIEDNIRKNILENSYFYDYKSLPVMSNFKCDQNMPSLLMGHKQKSYFGGNSIHNLYRQNISDGDESSDNMVDGDGVGGGKSDDDSQLLLTNSSNSGSLGQNYKKNINKPMIYNKKNSGLAAMGTTNVTLTNHSMNSSFIEISPHSAAASAFVAPKPLTSSITYTNNNFVSGDVGAVGRIEPKPPVQKYPRCMQESPDDSSYMSDEYEEQIGNDDPDNYLTSPRTHFRPIRSTYIDGHTFTIPSHWDKIEYTRSASGSMYLHSDRYQQYHPGTMNAFGSDEESDYGCANGGGCGYYDRDIANEEDFMLKFCVKQIEKGCQTDIGDEPFALNISCPSSGMTDLNYRPLTPSDTDIEYEIYTCFNRNGGIEVKRNANVGGCMAAEYSSAIDVNYNTGTNLDMEQWAMQSMTKRCSLNNNNTPHTLWQHCVACDGDEVSQQPANRLLKDELSADGDEIMSDLKCMRDLYIGNEWDEEEDDDNHEEDDDEDDDNDRSNGNYEDDDGRDGDDEDEQVEVDDRRKIKHKFVDADRTFNLSSSNSTSNSSTQDSSDILYNVNKLISDLLKPDRVKTLAEAFTASQHIQRRNNQVIDINKDNETVTMMTTMANNVRTTLRGTATGGAGGGTEQSASTLHRNSNLSDKFVGGLWDNNDNGIWRQEISPGGSSQADSSIWTAPPGGGRTATSSIDVTDHQNWNHAHLEQIWNDASAVVTNEEECDKIEHFIRTDNDDATCNNNANVDDDDDDEDIIELAYDISNEALQNYIEITQKAMNQDDAVIATVDDNTTTRFDISGNPSSFYYNNNNISDNHNKRDRKRRHSASQNLCEALDAIAGEHAHRKFSSMYDDSMNVTAIITCNYWATEAAAYNDERSGGGGGVGGITQQGQLEMNASAALLKHMSMVSSRPLTR